jgi:predicted DNA-binding transcriptional regulator YafY
MKSKACRALLTRIADLRRDHARAQIAEKKHNRSHAGIEPIDIHTLQAVAAALRAGQTVKMIDEILASDEISNVLPEPTRPQRGRGGGRSRA